MINLASKMSGTPIVLHRSLWTTGYWKGTISMVLNHGKEKGLLVPQANQVAFAAKLC